MKAIRGMEPKIAIVTTAIAYAVTPVVGKGETLVFMASVWLCAVLLIYGIEDQIEHFQKRRRRKRIREMKKQKRPELANIQILKGEE